MLVCWSGGLDSTLTLVDLAKRYAATPKGELPPDKYGLRALSIVHQQVPCQPQASKSRAAIRSLMKKRGWSFRHSTVYCRTKGRFEATVGTGLSQPLFWLSMAVGYLEEDEDLYMGYVHGDCIWHYTEHLMACFRAL